MTKYINSNKEIFCGDQYFLEHVAPIDFQYKVHKKELSPYFESKGFKVSMMYDDFYSRFNGIHSDKYIPMDLYYFYILPALNRYDFKNAYTDKNIFKLLFHDVNQPETIAKNMNGIFYVSDSIIVSEEEFFQFAGSIKEECIIKPTVCTCNGIGVAKLITDNKIEQEQQIRSYKNNFIIQKKVKQHSVMNKLNESSLNTLRVFTYRTLDGKIEYMTGKTFGRYGGKGAIMDNGSAGGGIFDVDEDGNVADHVVFFKKMQNKSFSELGIKNLRVPNLDLVKEMVVSLHQRLPHFDFVGWDIAIDEKGEPMLIEFNLEPSVEGTQMVSGPFFEKYLDEILFRISKVQKDINTYIVNTFKLGFDFKLKISSSH